MKKFLALNSMLLFTVLLCHAQTTISEKDLNNLVAISELYSRNTNATGDVFARRIDTLRTPALAHIVDALLAVGKGDTTILQNHFMSRPTNEELMLWYVMREIHYNQQRKTDKPHPNIEVARDILQQTIDKRCLLDNYYYRIHGGIGKCFNSANLSTYNFNLDSLGFQNETEKAIFFLSITAACIDRFQYFQMTKNNQKVLEYANKLPQFNGKPYYYYTAFSYEDFDWIGHEKTESYNQRHIGNLYTNLLAHLNALAELKDKEEARDFYFNSLLHEQQYFKYSQYSDDLKTMHSKMK